MIEVVVGSSVGEMVGDVVGSVVGDVDKADGDGNRVNHIYSAISTQENAVKKIRVECVRRVWGTTPFLWAEHSS